MRLLTAGLVALVATTVGGCGSAAGGIPGSQLGVTARDAYVEARSVARSWDPDARLRYVQGRNIAPSGVALPREGAWWFHYTAQGQVRELMVAVSALETASEERPVTSPPGFIIGDNALGPSWIDSPEALNALTTEREVEFEIADLLLVPARPEQWVIRPDGGMAWRVNAGTGEVLGQ